jgi:single-strand DNA-binding protein
MNENGTVNRVILAGEVSRAPQWYKNGDRSPDLCFTLTTKERYLQSGKEIEHAEDHSIRLPENKIGSQLKLGQWLHIEGKIKTQSFVDEQSVRRYKTEIIAMRVQLLQPNNGLREQAMANSESDQR